VIIFLRGFHSPKPWRTEVRRYKILSTTVAETFRFPSKATSTPVPCSGNL